MSTKERVLSRCKAVVESGAKCPESGVFVYWHIDFYELCYDGGKLCINADGTGEGFDAAARWLKLDNPWRVTAEELPEEDGDFLGLINGREHILKFRATAWGGRTNVWLDGSFVDYPTHWRKLPPKPQPATT